MLPCLGDLPIADISRGDVLELIRRIERRGALVSARKVALLRELLQQHDRFAQQRDDDQLHLKRGQTAAVIRFPEGQPQIKLVEQTGHVLAGARPGEV